MDEEAERKGYKSETDSVRQHPECYSRFCNPKKFSFVTSQESGPSYDPQERDPSFSESRATGFKSSVSYKGSAHVLNNAMEIQDLSPCSIRVL